MPKAVEPREVFVLTRGRGPGRAKTKLQRASAAAHEGPQRSEAAACIHRWQVASLSTGGVFPSTCSLCGATRQFSVDAEVDQSFRAWRGI